MKRKIIAFVFAAVITAVSVFLSVPAFAASGLDDGVYEVGVKMYHAQKDRVSMGDRYLVHTALLKVESGSETLTIATAERVSGMHFWYYDDGGVDGDVTEVQSVGEVTIDGETYPTAFEFPVIGDSGDVGVKFSAPVMPVSPSARIRIDYQSAKPHTEKSADAQAANAPAATTAPTSAPATKAAATSVAATTAPVTKAETTTNPISTTVKTTAAQASEAVTYEQSTETAKKSPAKVIVIACVCVILAAAAVVLIVLKVKGRI